MPSWFPSPLREKVAEGRLRGEAVRLGLAETPNPSPEFRYGPSGPSFTTLSPQGRGA